MRHSLRTVAWLVLTALLMPMIHAGAWQDRPQPSFFDATRSHGIGVSEGE